MSKVRMGIAALVLASAATIGGLKLHEGYTDHAVIPVKGDVPTLGHGSTYYENGARVKMGDTITRERAEKLLMWHVDQYGAALKRCVTGLLQQVELDILVDFAYQYGAGAACSSSIVRNINLGNYAAACQAYTLYKFVGNFDCSTPGNRRCPGVWTRSLDRRDRCMAVQ